MQSYPHQYAVEATGAATGSVALSAEGLPSLQTAPPAQFDGPGDEWSPETLFVGAVADCFILTFRAIARASSVSWTALRCHAVGTLDRVDGAVRFTQLALRAHLTVAAGVDVEKARRLLEKAEKACLISNSLAFTPTMLAEIRSAESSGMAA